MPELPEVETVRRGLARLLVGRVVRRATVYDSPKSFPNAPADVEQFLYGAKVVDARRRAKVLMIDLSTDYSLVVHLKMTGQLVFRGGAMVSVSRISPKNNPGPGDEHAQIFFRDTTQDRLTSAGDSGISGKHPKVFSKLSLVTADIHDEANFAGGHPTDSLIGELPDRSTRVEIDFTDGSKLFFNDQRKFGWMKLMPTVEIENLPFMQKVGPEPLDPKTKPQDFIERVRRRNNSMIKPAILDQSVIAGVGNIYADEALWAAKIHPETRVRQVADEQLNTLFNEIVAVLKLSIEKGGSTDKNYIDVEGQKGSYLTFAHVFRREGRACHRHPDQEIVKLKVGGRGTHICPVCQAKVDE